MVDLHGLFRARWYGYRDGPAIPLYAPDGVPRRVAELEEGDPAPVRSVFEWYPLPAEPYRVGPFTLESLPLPHYVPNAGVRLSAPGLVIAYTGDTGPDPALAELGRDADLYIIEATDRYQNPNTPTGSPGLRRSLDARDAGEVAAAAGAHRLMLTHFWPGNDRQRSRASAATAFAGEILLADEGLEVLC
jgi:ribonuclease BN (tRNA processing enzyme)